MPKSLKQIYQLHIALEGTSPMVWRRIQVVDSIRLDKLHLVLQAAMGWENAHQHIYMTDKATYGIPDPEWDLEPIEDEKRFKLRNLVQNPQQSFTYEYDLGDSWQHHITLEAVLPYTENFVNVQLLEGENACPPEDIGGVLGFEQLLEFLDESQNNDGELFSHLQDFDPQYFPLADVQKNLQQIKI